MTAQQWVTLAVGISATIGVLATLWQRQRSEQRDRAQQAADRAQLAEHDARSEWWRRYEWAADRAYDDRDLARQEAGLEVLGVLATSSLVTVSERRLVEVLVTKNKLSDNEGHEHE